MKRLTLALPLIVWGVVCVFVQTAAQVRAPSAPEKAQCYVKKSTWGETLLSSRERYARWRKALLGGVELGPWYATNRKEAFSPETPVDFAAGKRRGGRHWTRRLDFFDGQPHYDLNATGENIFFLAREIAAPTDDASVIVQKPRGELNAWKKESR